MESHARSIVKAATWRLGGFVMTVGVAWVLTRRADLAATIGLTDTAVKLLAFYVHERLWLKVKFGRTKPPEYQI
ncbi:MAG: hypothetical protein BWX88_05000 [Planctomycetes bacterium ADurb.Bin126]|nr:MAG: hypothetical protein BWX88_05000 [Planctomycetes bacterium ADurb.Bin126]HOD84133.1 DUF2061 domain-containing protein [Phycisphaerae bacterium]HQL76131.1 DUF2061 domain-containing protein [Phycisphaerae bacterium]